MFVTGRGLLRHQEGGVEDVLPHVRAWLVDYVLLLCYCLEFFGNSREEKLKFTASLHLES